MWRKKSTWAGIAALFTAIGGFASGEVGLAPSLIIAFQGVQGIFQRHATFKLENGK